MRSGNTSGQAMLELIIGMVALLALFAGLLQLARLSTARTDAMARARREAGFRAMSAIPVSSAAEHIRTWQEGPDEKRYSADDVYTTGDSGAFVNAIVNRAARDTSDWGLLESVPQNDIQALRESPVPIALFGLFEGSESVTIPLYPVVRHLLYDADSLTLDCTVWMPWMREIY